MLAKVTCVSCIGLSPIEVEVEVNLSEKGFPGLTIVGMSSKAGEEAKERIRTAIVNSLFEFPNAKITVNLAPADVSKDGSSFDLPIALGILIASGNIGPIPEKAYYFGELSLDGGLRHSKGVFLLALLAKEKGVKKIYVPRICANEAGVIEGIEVLPVDNLRGLVAHLRGSKQIEPLKRVDIESILEKVEPEYDFGEVLGQEMAKRAIEIAAAGGHNLLMIGPPGSGKTMLARAIPGILPNLNEQESLEVSKIYSITGNFPAGSCLIKRRPFRSPHHTTSEIGLIGGGTIPKPGEISLAHRGVLFLDEFPEFSRTCIESMRQPMEDGWVTVSRAFGSVKFPADFMLVVSANPCPCGFWGDSKNNCKCSLNQIKLYQRKLSGPIMDRIDIHLNVAAVDTNKLTIDREQKPEEKSESIRVRVAKAREKQSRRFKDIEGIYCNADMKNKHLRNLAKLSQEANLFLKEAIRKLNISARSYFRLVKVSRTIADLEDCEEVNKEHVAEAMVYRFKNDDS
jgi:magnesium chelatase family protein